MEENLRGVCINAACFVCLKEASKIGDTEGLVVAAKRGPEILTARHSIIILNC